MNRYFAAIAAAILAFFAGAPAAAAPVSLKLADSFRIGSGGVLCTAQTTTDAAGTMFDRNYLVVCRDAATPVGSLRALRGPSDAALHRILTGRKDNAVCAAAATPAGLLDVPTAVRRECRLGSGLIYVVYNAVLGNTTYVAEGFAGYDSALRIGLRSVALDRRVTGDVEVAATGAGDPAAFARVQAGSLDADQALAEAYVRNNSGSYAEAAEFFDSLVERSGQGGTGSTRSAEYLANQALQQSNLGNFAEAAVLFDRAAQVADPSDPVILRILRNFRAMHQLNRGRDEAALAELKVTALDVRDVRSQTRVAAGYIDQPIAQKLNIDDAAVARLGGVDGRLTVAERATTLDAQALYLQATVLRQQGRYDESRAMLGNAMTMLGGIRQGRLRSASWLRSATLTEIALISEAQNQPAAARTALEQAVLLYRIEYPASASLLAAQARLAALLARQGERDAAITMFREIVRSSPTTPGAADAVGVLVRPYFDLLAARGGDAATDFFAASQILARPGVAQTQAVLARELSGGSDAAAGLFRQSVTLSRDLVRAEVDIGRLSAKSELSGDDAANLAAARESRATLGRQQTVVLAQLAEFPRYRVIANDIVTLADLQAKLRPGEAYYKLMIVGDAAFGLTATQKTAEIVRVGATAAELTTMVATLRSTIVTFENGRAATYPFDAPLARRLYVALFGPVDAAIKASSHLIFEPDGAMLQLPVNLLIVDQPSLDAYEKRAATATGDPFDMTGVGWLGRSRIVSTAVSPRAFLDVRAIAGSKGAKAYLGMGENAIPAALPATGLATDPCAWPLAQWRNPIAATELRIGAETVGRGNSDVLTGAAFNDTAIDDRTDLKTYRVIHFATHGLVTAPRPECPARPALLTSFGSGASDGLLTFKEIFDLRLDADTIILSACDTAGTATRAATREAGVATGGNSALDGLVRAFVGAGARAVIASHWPVPDDYDATKTLITGLFSQVPGISVGEALRVSEVRLMDAGQTSHPYYWSGFAIIGDAAKPLSGAPAVTPARLAGS